jgi:hypothetical protein
MLANIIKCDLNLIHLFELMESHTYVEHFKIWLEIILGLIFKSLFICCHHGSSKAIMN